MSKVDEYVPHTESLYARFSHEASRIYSNGKLGLQERLGIISERAYSVVNSAEHRFAKLHRDFRSGAKSALESLKVRINQELTKYEQV